MTRLPIKTLPGSILNPEPSEIADCWIDCADEATHTIEVDGSRWANCKLGSGNKMGPLSKDRDGRWCVRSFEVNTL